MAAKDEPSGAPTAADCAACGARCCRYVATEIDRPTCKRDMDHIRWYLLHRGISVFVDHEGGWYLEIEAPCEALRPDMRCANYADRPRICRRHGVDGASCEFLTAPALPYRRRFTSAAAFEAWLDRRGNDWRWKHPRP